MFDTNEEFQCFLLSNREALVVQDERRRQMANLLKEMVVQMNSQKDSGEERKP